MEEKYKCINCLWFAEHAKHDEGECTKKHEIIRYDEKACDDDFILYSEEGDIQC